MLKLALLRVTEEQTEVLYAVNLAAELAAELSDAEGRVLRKRQLGQTLVEAVNAAVARVEERVKLASTTV